VRRVKVESGSRSPRSAKAFSVKTSVCRFGMLRARSFWRDEILLRAQYRLVNRLLRGKFPRTVSSLSVRSMASIVSFATPRFSMLGILWPDDCGTGCEYDSALFTGFGDLRFKRQCLFLSDGVGTREGMMYLVGRAHAL